MNAHKLAVTLSQDGTLVLEGLPFQAGDRVEIIILEQLKDSESVPSSGDRPLAGSVLRHEEPTEPVADGDYLNAVAATLTEWDSAADEQAYQNL